MNLRKYLQIKATALNCSKYYLFKALDIPLNMR